MNSRPIRLTTSTLRVADRMQPPAGAGRALREIGRPQDARVAVDIGDELALVPDVVAGRQDIDAAIVEFAAEALGQSEAAGRVLGVDDDAGRERIPAAAAAHAS